MRRQCSCVTRELIVAWHGRAQLLRAQDPPDMCSDDMFESADCACGLSLHKNRVQLVSRHPLPNFPELSIQNVR